jgi:hypothetical protein
MTPAERDARAAEFAEAVARAMREDRTEVLAEAIARAMGQQAGPVDGRAMLADGLAAVAQIEADRQAQYDRNRAARERGMALYQQVRARHLRELGMPPELVPSHATRPDRAPYNSPAPPGVLLGRVQPDPSQIRTVVL